MKKGNPFKGMLNDWNFWICILLGMLACGIVYYFTLSATYAAAASAIVASISFLLPVHKIKE